MTSDSTQDQIPYGGDWTVEKLRNLDAYADAYTTALKNQPFRLIYFDAFAGEGTVAIKSGIHAGSVLDGSATVAVQISDKRFDELKFVERDEAIAQRLRVRLGEIAAGGSANVIVGDANEEVAKFCYRMDDFDRALVLLDPFATEVSWSAVEALARTKKCDVLILFPTMPIRRMLKRYDNPEDARFKEQLNRIYGNDSWQGLYKLRQQRSMFEDDPEFETDSGAEGLVEIYRSRLNEVFADSISQSLTNKNNSRLFEFMVAWGDPKGARVGKRIAKWIIEHEEPFPEIQRRDRRSGD